MNISYILDFFEAFLVVFHDGHWPVVREEAEDGLDVLGEAEVRPLRHCRSRRLLYQLVKTSFRGIYYGHQEKSSPLPPIEF